MIKLIDKDFDKKVFNDKAVHPLQSWEWGEAREKHGIEVLRIAESASGGVNDNLKNVFTITFHKIPHTNFKIGYLPRSVWPSEEVLEFIADEARKKKAIFIKIEPYIKIENLDIENSLNPDLIGRKLKIKKSSHPLFPNWTLMMDLTKSEEELLKGMKPKTRYNIRVAEKHGVEIREKTDNEGFEIFAKLYFETCKRQGYRGHDESYHKIIFDSLKKEIAHILVAFFNESPLSVYELFIFNDVLYYPYGGSSTENKNVMAPNLLMWEAIKFGKSHGAKKFDMWGSEPPDYNIDSGWSGFTRFKEGYGAQFVEFAGSYDLILNNSLYILYNNLNKLRKIFLQM